MDAASVFRLISLIPDRTLRAQSGGAFAVEGNSDRVALLAKFLHWLGPLDALSKQDQQLLGVRAGNGRVLADDAEPGEDLEPLEAEADEPEAEETRTMPSQTGTQIAV